MTEKPPHGLLDVAGLKAQALGYTPQDEMNNLSCIDLIAINSQ